MTFRFSELRRKQDGFGFRYVRILLMKAENPLRTEPRGKAVDQLIDFAVLAVALSKRDGFRLIGLRERGFKADQIDPETGVDRIRQSVDFQPEQTRDDF